MQGTLKPNVATKKFNNLENYLIHNFYLDSLEAEEIVIHLQRMLRRTSNKVPSKVVAIDLAKKIFLGTVMLAARHGHLLHRIR